MSADSRLLVQAVREGINREHLLLNDVDGQLGWSRDKTKNVFSGRTKLSGDDVLDILSNPNVPIRTLSGIACSCGSDKLCSRRRKTGD